jgi:Holliday junction resolvase
MRIRALKEWFTNFGTIFSILGFIATLYFGIFYVPTWLQESKNEKINNAENEIMQSVKELIYADSTLTLDELPTLIHAKEITLKQRFPLSLDDILIKTEESFMEDRFLPLNKRRELAYKIERIKSQLPNESKKQVDKLKSEIEGTHLEVWTSLIITVLAVILGVISKYFKFNSEKDKEAEIQNEIQEILTEKDSNEFVYEFEKNIKEALSNRSDIVIQSRAVSDKGIDIVFSKGEKQYFIEVKYLSRSKVGINTCYKLIHYLKDKRGEAWLVYNTDLTPIVAQLINDFNKENNQVNIRPIKISNSKEFADILDDILPK